MVPPLSGTFLRFALFSSKSGAAVGRGKGSPQGCLSGGAVPPTQRVVEESCCLPCAVAIQFDGLCASCTSKETAFPAHPACLQSSARAGPMRARVTCFRRDSSVPRPTASRDRPTTIGRSMSPLLTVRMSFLLFPQHESTPSPSQSGSRSTHPKNSNRFRTPDDEHHIAQWRSAVVSITKQPRWRSSAGKPENRKPVKLSRSAPRLEL